jgi:hypothetical protein
VGDFLHRNHSAMGSPTTKNRARLEKMIAKVGWEMVEGVYVLFENRPQGLGGLKDAWGMFLSEARSNIQIVKRNMAAVQRRAENERLIVERIKKESSERQKPDSSPNSLD